MTARDYFLSDLNRKGFTPSMKVSVKFEILFPYTNHGYKITIGSKVLDSRISDEICINYLKKLEAEGYNVEEAMKSISI